MPGGAGRQFQTAADAEEKAHTVRTLSWGMQRKLCQAKGAERAKVRGSGWEGAVMSWRLPLWTPHRSSPLPGEPSPGLTPRLGLWLGGWHAAWNRFLTRSWSESQSFAVWRYPVLGDRTGAQNKEDNYVLQALRSLPSPGSHPLKLSAQKHSRGDKGKASPLSCCARCSAVRASELSGHLEHVPQVS